MCWIWGDINFPMRSILCPRTPIATPTAPSAVNITGPEARHHVLQNLTSVPVEQADRDIGFGDHSSNTNTPTKVIHSARSVWWGFLWLFKSENKQNSTFIVVRFHLFFFYYFDLMIFSLNFCGFICTISWKVLESAYKSNLLLYCFSPFLKCKCFCR